MKRACNRRVKKLCGYEPHRERRDLRGRQSAQTVYPIQDVFLLVATHTDRQELPSFSVHDSYGAARFHVGWSFDLHESILTECFRTRCASVMNRQSTV